MRQKNRGFPGIAHLFFMVLLRIMGKLDVVLGKICGGADQAGYLFNCSRPCGDDFCDASIDLS